MHGQNSLNTSRQYDNKIASRASLHRPCYDNIDLTLSSISTKVSKDVLLVCQSARVLVQYKDAILAV